MIKATPFVKWVGGKRQLISQLEKFFHTEFNNYNEPFLGGGAVFFFNLQKENILNVSKLLNKTKAKIKLQSFEKVIKNTNTGDFIYFDPPYDTLSKTANFTSYNESGFGREMQKVVRNF